TRLLRRVLTPTDCHQPRKRNQRLASRKEVETYLRIKCRLGRPEQGVGRRSVVASYSRCKAQAYAETKARQVLTDLIGSLLVPGGKTTAASFSQECSGAVPSLRSG